MKVALLITSFNRPEYLRQCLESVKQADLSRIDKIIIVDDCSTDAETHKLLSNFIMWAGNTVSFVNDANSGIKASLKTGYDYAFGKGYDLVINLDSDAIVMPDFVNRLLEVYSGMQGDLLTGFNCTTLNANGSDRHKIIGNWKLNIGKEKYMLYKKQSVGGINLCIDKIAYNAYVKPALLHPTANWDHLSCINAGGAYCLKQSVIQHIGYDSSMGHTENPDVADDFGQYIPNVTLLGFDYNNRHRLEIAKNKCTQRLHFEVVKMITDVPCTSKEAYSEWCIKHLHENFTTSHVLVFQHDGFVNNPDAWNDEWLQYDYIGAPWYYQDGMAVGNGGFSLRSRKLCEAVSKLVTVYHPEDHHICRTYRPQLEAMGFKFAPLEVAERFSFEGYMMPQTHLTDQFGVHGQRREVVKTGRRYCVNQFRGLGDILFLVPLIRALMQEGNEVIWPIADEYYEIHTHFPDIKMVRKSEVNVPYDTQGIVETPHGRLLPYRYAMELMGRDLTACMRSKYNLYGHNHNMWRSLYWKRDTIKEHMLRVLVGAAGKYQLVNRYYGEATRGMFIKPEPNPDLPIVEMRTIPGYTLIDWCGIIEGASEIHTANTSLLYLLEIMPLTMPIHFYRRGTWGEAGYEHTQELYTKDYILH